MSFLVGAERQSATASISDGSRHDLGATSAFAVAQWRPIKQLTTSASVRYDDPDKYRGQTTARAGAGYDLGAGFTLAASYGQGFKTPTISETVCDFCYTTPMVSLAPERADGEDLGLVWRSADGRFSARATAYQLDIRDEIAYVGGRYINIAQTRSRGVEAELEAALGAGFRVKAAYAHDDAFDRSTGLRELRVPPDSLSGALFWNRGKVDAALTVRNESSQADTALDGFSRFERPGFTVASLAGGYALTRRLTLTGRVENLADTHYEESYGYGEPGRSVFVGFRFRD
jgi:vitamin B12 transporter